jgi:hypothetical protein
MKKQKQKRLDTTSRLIEAPAGCLSHSSPGNRPFSATSLVGPQTTQNKGRALAPATISLLRKSRFGSSSLHQFLTAPHFTIMVKPSMFATLSALKLLPILAALQLPFLGSSWLEGGSNE